MRKVHIDSFYVVSEFKPHSAIRDELIDTIENDVGVDFRNSTSYIKTDWGSYNQRKRRYYSLIEEDLESHMSSVYRELGYSGHKIYNAWYQQYYKTGKHGWHTHMMCQWTNVYYVEFPAGAPKTELINPYDNSSIFVDVKEGDILTFPSLILHRAPEVMDDLRKTIISFNSDSSY